MMGRTRLAWPWRWRVVRTLRGRLIAGLVALLAVACATVGLVTYIAVQRSLSSELNNQLQTATSTVNQCLDNQLGGDSDDHGGLGGTAISPGAPSGQASRDGNKDSAVRAGQPQGSDCASYGLGPGTFYAFLMDGQWTANLVQGTDTLTAADKNTLDAIPPSPEGPPGSPVPTYTRYLESARGEYQLTVVADRGGATYVTGLPLAGQRDLLRDVALVEAVIFGGVLLLAGVLGTLWVRLSLRPLRRVAATASQVAELPLESGEVELPRGVPDTDPVTETGQVGLAFNRMLGHVQTALKRRAASEARLRRFAADASHELRTPLAAIRGYAELAMLHPGQSPDAVTHALSRVLSESTRMSVLVDDLLLLARLDAGRPLSREPVDMSRLAIDVTSDSRVARPDHRWVLELPDDPVVVSGDEHRLHQVLGNLLSNAGRHSPDGTTVTVKVSAELPPGEPATRPESVRHGAIPPQPRMVLTVTDDGPGISPELLPDLFERFTRADTSRSHATNASSTGLGLAIVDAVVAAHSGAVLVTSRPGMTRFTIVLAQLAADNGDAGQQRRARPARRALHRS
jgi:two-component system, OmpR family, sensor kinase